MTIGYDNTVEEKTGNCCVGCSIAVVKRRGRRKRSTALRYVTLCHVTVTGARFLLVDWFWGAWEGSQKSEGFLDFNWDWWWSREVSSVRLVSVFVGDVTGLDGLAVWGHVGHGALEHGNWSFSTSLQVTDRFLFDTVFGLEAKTIPMKTIMRISVSFVKNQFVITLQWYTIGSIMLRAGFALCKSV